MNFKKMRTPDTCNGSWDATVAGVVNEILEHDVRSEKSLATLARYLMEVTDDMENFMSYKSMFDEVRDFLALGNTSDEMRKFFRARCEELPWARKELVEYLLGGPVAPL